MRFTKVLYLAKSVRDEMIEMRAKSSKSATISDFLTWLYRERNFSLISGFKNFQENQRTQAINAVNKFFEPDYNRLGAELHAATYTLKLGGRCRLFGSPRWLSLDNRNIRDVLPEERVQNFYVEGLDLSKTVIKADGISNIENCSKLKTLVLNNCIYNDDWLLARVSHVFSETLERLDISNCENVTDNGLLTLGYLKFLKRLKLGNLDGAKNKEFISILLEDNLEGLIVEGSDHLSEEAFKHVETMLKEEDLNLKKIIESNK